MWFFNKFCFLDFIIPFSKFVPTIERPRKVKFEEKLIWTALSLFVYLVCCEVPLYGVSQQETTDPLYFLRLLMASNRGTLMELGISPALTSSMIMQIITSTGIISVSSPKKWNLLRGVQRLISLIFVCGQASLYVFSGMYGPPYELGMGNCSLLVLQLFMGGVIVMLLDDLLQAGYGIGGGLNLFIATNLCEMIVWKAFSPLTIDVGRGRQFEGAILELVKALISKERKLKAFEEVLFRKGLPNLMSLGLTIALFFLIAYIQAFKMEIPLRSASARGQNGSFPIKLAYTNMPMVLQSAFTYNVLIISKLLSALFPGHFMVDLLGIWETSEDGSTEPTWGICYYLSSVNTLADFKKDPFRALVNVTFTLLSCVYFSLVWLTFSGKSAKHVVRELKRENLMIGGHRHSSMTKYLNHYIQTAAALGGLAVGTLTIFSNVFGVIGSATSILMTVNVICNYYDEFLDENTELSDRRLISPKKIGVK